ncbi:hypothetical protein GCM10023143_00750 [Compostibacter hankyongensis]|uniref:Uncharacterized protein n=1 Tax=Compostibacter hankyongensis TaxID=1007089 RepID=A0ABP8FBV1_9BACT
MIVVQVGMGYLRPEAVSGKRIRQRGTDVRADLGTGDRTGKDGNSGKEHTAYEER